MEEEILRKLQGSEWFRERKNKNRGIALMLQEKYHLNVDVSRLQAMIEDASSMDRFWRKCLQDYPALRGRDYLDSKKLAQEKVLELGYEVGYNKDIKQSHA